MPFIVYEEKKFGAKALATIHQANEILEEYEAQGFGLTLRQLYYQFVARDLFANIERNYKRLGQVVNDARLAGLIDWDHISDRTRNVRSLRHWNDPADIISWAHHQYRIPIWDRQPTYVETWIEKDALVDVIATPSQEMDCPYFSCRGYTSQSEMWGASRRLLTRLLEGKRVVVLHLGDHDPSGIDMTRDIKKRLRLFCWMDYVRAKIDDGEFEADDQASIKRCASEVLDRFEVRRIALNMDQIDQYNPPPNPAKVSDSRYADYAVRFGEESWELDALEPSVIADLVRSNIESEIDGPLWDEAMEEEQRGTRLLRSASVRWGEVEGLFDDNTVTLSFDDAQALYSHALSRIPKKGSSSAAAIAKLGGILEQLEQEEDDDGS